MVVIIIIIILKIQKWGKICVSRAFVPMVTGKITYLGLELIS